MSVMTLNRSEIAQLFGVSLPTISQWLSKGMPFESKGTQGRKWSFNASEVVKWREAMIVSQAIGDTSGLDLDEARRRKLAAEAAMVELDLAKRKGEVIEIDAVAGVVGDDYANVRAKLLSLPTKLAPQLIGIDDVATCKALIERGVSEALEEFTADGIYTNGGADSEIEPGEKVKSKAAA